MDNTTKFVQLVKSYPCLYNNTLQNYSKKDVTERAWSHIAREMNSAAADCKEKWRNIRNSFVRSLKPSTSGTFSREKKPYYMRDLMEFVLPYVRPIQNSEHSNSAILPDSDQQYAEDVDSIENTEDTKSDIMIDMPRRAQDTTISIDNHKRRKYSEEQNDIEQDILHYAEDKEEYTPSDDAKKMFLLSLLPDVRKLSDVRLRHFKIRTLIMLDELLSEQEQKVVQQILSEHCTQQQRFAPASKSAHTSASSNNIQMPTSNSGIRTAAIESDPNDSFETKDFTFENA